MIFSIIIFILTLLVLVVIHEWGHFIMAKKFGIKVEEFGFGLPPRVWGKKIGETIYSINWLPFGGFVKLLGEDGVEKEELKNKRSFAAANVWVRIGVVAAGVSMNLVLAWILFYIVLFSKDFKFQLPLPIDYQFAGVEQKNDIRVFIAAISTDSPAFKTSLKQGEEIISVNGENILNDGQMVSLIKSYAGKEINLTVKNPQSNEVRDIKLIPRENPPKGEGPIGIALTQVRLANLEYKTTTQKLFSGVSHSYNVASYSLKMLGLIINQSFAKKDFSALSHSVAGPVGITSLANTVLTSTDKPLIPYLDFMAMLSLNLAVMNLLPIPALDGGRLFFLLIEGILRRKVKANIEKWVHAFGMAVLLGLTLLITFSDIKKLFP